jgi:hypothetical protein
MSFNDSQQVYEAYLQQRSSSKVLHSNTEDTNAAPNMPAMLVIKEEDEDFNKPINFNEQE